MGEEEGIREKAGDTRRMKVRVCKQSGMALRITGEKLIPGLVAARAVSHGGHSNTG